MSGTRTKSAFLSGPTEQPAGGGGETLIVDTLIFDSAQITCPTNGLNPKWGGMHKPHRGCRTNDRDNQGD